MKVMGEEFKVKREEIGITVEEVSNDLKKDYLLIENLESGNFKVFKDILELKEVVEMYAKYLGLDEERLLSDLDDYLFEKTSKISLDDIQERLKKDESSLKKVRTPYTLELQKKKNITWVIIMFLTVIILVIFYVLLKQLFM